jgi:hypothetical protein
VAAQQFALVPLAKASSLDRGADAVHRALLRA